jgi:hypothetical protein
VYFEEGNVRWCWKFRFAVQCSNFGEILDLLSGQEGIRVKRYAGEDGEYVSLWALKDVLLEALERLMDGIAKCPVCWRPECGKATKEMLEALTKAVKTKSDETQIEEIYAKFFIEYR